MPKSIVPLLMRADPESFVLRVDRTTPIDQLLKRCCADVESDFPWSHDWRSPEEYRFEETEVLADQPTEAEYFLLRPTPPFGSTPLSLVKAFLASQRLYAADPRELAAYAQTRGEPQYQLTCSVGTFWPKLRIVDLVTARSIRPSWLEANYMLEERPTLTYMTNPHCEVLNVKPLLVRHV